jgi:hypothetical protein
MELARHSDPRLTAKVYGRKSRHRLTEAIKKLPTGTPDDSVCRRLSGVRIAREELGGNLRTPTRRTSGNATSQNPCRKRD